jgi:hypothetical protein
MTNKEVSVLSWSAVAMVEVMGRAPGRAATSPCEPGLANGDNACPVFVRMMLSSHATPLG